MLELIFRALAYSSCIALMAGSITLIYMATGTFNFAHASMIAWAFYIVYTLQTFLGGSPYYYLPAAALFSGFLGVLTYIGVNRYLLKKGAGMVTLMMSTLGVDLIMFSALNMFADYLSEVHKLYSRQIILEVFDFSLGKVFGAELKGSTIVSLILVFAVLISLHLFLTKTDFGISMRAAIENPALAGLLGTNPDLIYLSAWFIGGAIAGLGGGLMSMITAGYPAVGMYLIVTMFAGSIVGGLYSIYGSLLGGFLIGLSEYLGIYGLSGAIGPWILAYRQVIPLTAMVITLLIYPMGLGGIQWSKLLEKTGLKIKLPFKLGGE